MMGQRYAELVSGRVAQLFVVLWLIFSSSAVLAGVRNDRVYKFGEGDGENGAAGEVVGTGVTVPGAGDTLDDVGPTGAFLDLNQAGNPTYINVFSGAKARPGTTAGELGIQFNGTSTRLQGIPLNRPDELETIIGSYPYNYEDITARGAQMWVYPDQAGLDAGVYQSIMFDTIMSGGPSITADGKWSQMNSQHADGTDGIAQIPSTVAVASGDTWYHVMHHVYHRNDPGAPRIVPGTGGASDFTSVVYVDGIAVSVNNDGIVRTDDAGFPEDQVGVLAVGAAEIANDGITPSFSNYFRGVIDNLDMYVYGDNSDLPGGENYGTFDLFADNVWIANEISTEVPGGVLIPGDTNRNGVVSGDGSGPVGTDDVAAFVANWRRENRFDGAHNVSTAGDWETWTWGDFDHDGRVLWNDWFLLRANHPDGPNLDLAALVPEPHSAALLLGAISAWLLAARQRRPSQVARRG